MTVAIERGFDAIGREAWDRLARSSRRATMFQSWGWQRAWWRAHERSAGDALEPFLVAVRGREGLQALAPLMLEGQGSRRVLKFIGDGSSTLSDVIHADEHAAAFDVILAYLKEQASLWSAIELNDIPEKSPTASLLTAWAARAGFAAVVGEGTPCATLSVDAPHPGGSESFHVSHTGDRREIGAQLHAFFVQHIHRWSSDDAQSRFALRSSRDLFRHLADDPGEGSEVLFTTLRSGDVPVAFNFGMVSGRSLWCEPSFDVLRESERPGAALLRALKSAAQARGIDDLVAERRGAFAGPALSDDMIRRVSVRVTKEGTTSPLRKRLARTALIERASALVSELRQAAHVAVNASRIIEGRKARAREAASHLDFYDADSITKQYVRETRLQKPEQAILRELRSTLASMRVLDVGVGAGRTVPYFGTLSPDYRAFDFAPNMVAACRELTGDIVDPLRITAGDARDMSDVADGSCDFVLISYNAIDDIGGESDRFAVLREVRRVAAPGGYFCFSSHNMKSLTPGGAIGVLPRLRRWRRYRLLRAANPRLSEQRKSPNAMIHDVGMDYLFPHYYIAPSAQARQLEEFGFTGVRVFSVNSGEEVLDPERWDELIDSWVYYLCRAPASSP